VSEVADTSIQALKQKRENGTLKTDREKCLYIIAEYGPITSKDMELHLGKNKHTFSGRINELKDEQLVEVVGTEDGHQLLDMVEHSDVEKVDESGDEFVSMSEDLEGSEEDVEGLFKNDKQSEEDDLLWEA